MDTIPPDSGARLRDATAADGPAIAAIYSRYVLDTRISMETQAVDGDEIARRMAEVHAAGLPWIVLEAGGALAGWAYAGKWRARPGYRHTVETTVYLAPDACGRGHGTLLYGALLERLRGRFHSAIGGIALPNAASVALHERMGFRQVALFEQVGRKLGAWVDVGYWQLLFPEAPGAAEDGRGRPQAPRAGR